MRALVLVVVLVAAACDAFGASSGDTPPMTDAGSVTSSGAVTGADAGSRDGDANGTDADSDAAPPVMAFCTDPHHVFCTGFDTGTPPYGFTGGSSGFPFTDVAGVAPPSSPRAVQVSALAGDGADKFVSWTSGNSAKPSVVKVQFQMRIAALPSGSSADAPVLGIVCNNGAKVRLKVKSSGKLQLEGTITTGSTAPVPKDTWGRIELAWSTTDTTATLTSALIPGETLLASATACEAPFTVSLGFSDFYEAPTGPYTVMFDDVEIAEE